MLARIRDALETDTAVVLMFDETLSELVARSAVGLAELLSRTRELLGTDTAAVLLLDEPGTELVARAAVGLAEEVERGVRIPLSAGFAGRIAAERRTIVLVHVDHADFLDPLLREKGIKSILGAPLMVSDSVLAPRRTAPASS